MLYQQREFTEMLWNSWFSVGKQITEIKECNISIGHLKNKTIRRNNVGYINKKYRINVKYTDSLHASVDFSWTREPLLMSLVSA